MRYGTHKQTERRGAFSLAEALGERTLAEKKTQKKVKVYGTFLLADYLLFISFSCASERRIQNDQSKVPGFSAQA